MEKRLAGLFLRSGSSLLAAILLLPDAVFAGPDGGQPPQSQPHATVLFDQAVYRRHDCVAITLAVPEANVPQGPFQPIAELATTNGLVAGMSRVTVPLTEVQPLADQLRVFTSRHCVALRPGIATARPGTLGVEPGEALMVLARDAQGTPLAISSATIAGGRGTGRFRAVIDPQVAPEVARVEGEVDEDDDRVIDPQDAPRNAVPRRRIPVGAAVDPQGHRTVIVEDHVIFRETKPGGLHAFLKRRGGRVLNTVTVPSLTQQGRPEGAPLIFHVVKVDLAKVERSDFEMLVERFTSLQGTWRYSSVELLTLAALLAQELAAGNMVFADNVGEGQATPVSDEGVLNDWFNQNWFDPTITGPPEVHAGEAMALAEILLKPFPFKPTPRIATAIIDGGFAQPSDFGLPAPPVTLDYGVPFGAIPQCAIDSVGIPTCGPGTAGGPNPGSCTGGSSCPWHGTGSFSAAGAVLNNGYGAAGVGWRVVSPELFKLSGEQTLISQSVAILMSVAAGAKVINMSLSADCIEFGINWCDPVIAGLFGKFFCALFQLAYPGVALPCAVIVDLATLLENETALEAAIWVAEGTDAVVVAAAGNADLLSGEAPVDVKDVHRIPCILANVICVGALDSAGKAPFIQRANFSGFGDLVNVWAPGTNVAATPMPGAPLPTPGSPALPLINGTSIATPVVSGSLALARALAPGLTPAGVRALLAASNCRSGGTARVAGGLCNLTGDPLVDAHGYLDVLELVRGARQAAGGPSLGICTGGFGIDEDGPGNDTPATAVAVAPVPAFPGAESQYPLLGDGDLAIHALRNPIAVDDDWYQLTLQPRCPTTAFVTTVTVPIPDPTLGTLLVNLFRVAPDPTKPPIPVPILSVCSPASGPACPDRIETTVIMQSDVTYLAQVTARNATQTNCYSGIRIHLNNPVEPPLNSGCPP
jgi:hypothetical protein